VNISGVSLADQFGTRTVTVGDVKRICNPANVNNEDPTAPNDPDHLVAYDLSNINPPFQTVPNQVVSNEFGTITVDVVMPQLLLLPSAKSLSGPPPPLGDDSFDHFLCYQTRGGQTQVNNVHIDDEFGTIIVDVKQPVRLCVPVDKNGEGIPDPTAYLMCYQVRIDSSSAFTPAGQVIVNNQFGPDGFQSYKTTELCIPSLLNP
jgi:hypothetical protein